MRNFWINYENAFAALKDIQAGVLHVSVLELAIYLPYI